MTQISSRGSLLGPGLIGAALAAPIALLLLFVAAFAVVPSGPVPLSGATRYENPDSPATAEGTGDPADPGTPADTGDADAATPSVGSSEASALLARLAEQPVATWIVPERNPVTTVQADVAAIISSAASAGKVPTLVIYGIPNRDCDNHSAGGLSDADYPTWIAAIAAALTTRPSVVIVEPDALALTTGSDGAGAGCANDTADRTVAHVRDAVATLAGTAATVYIDAGHSNWVKPAVMAALLKRAGVDSARGFSTNVSNYNADVDEHVYAQELSRSVGDAHYVVDTSRNGNGSTGEWCNPAGRALGVLPGSVRDGTLADNDAHDANLWIKPPGESDGPCNGGPAAGEWWPEIALELATNAGW